MSDKKKTLIFVAVVIGLVFIIFFQYCVDILLEMYKKIYKIGDNKHYEDSDIEEQIQINSYIISSGECKDEYPVNWMFVTFGKKKNI